jgi:thiazole tautomerase (transcriptional regulator TenI)
MHVLAISPGEGLDPSRWARVLASGVDGFMIREPRLEAADLLRAARWVRERAPAVELWINGRLDVALSAGCGLHAPEACPDPPPLLPVSRPIHDPAQIPARAGAAQLILSPIFPVPGKGPAWGAERLKAVLDAMPAVNGRVLALGGIGPGNAGELRHPRLAGVALIRGLWGERDPGEVVAALREIRAGRIG